MLKRLLYIAAVIGICLAVWFHKGNLVRLVGWPFLPETPPKPAGTVRFAVIGDYGSGELTEYDVARLIKSWQPDFIATTGDNHYPSGPNEGVDDIDRHIGKFYHDYIGNYRGRYGEGAKQNRFFPIPGHRDWDVDDLKPYLDFFSLPGNERYYDFVWGPVHCFMLDTDEREPDGADLSSIQADWLRNGLASSKSTWKLVFLQHAPYTSHAVEDITRMRWPFKEWGADAVVCGYYHVYERLLVQGIPYFVNGAGGTWVSGFGEIDPHSQFRYNDDNGAMLVDADAERISFRFINRKGDLIDSSTFMKTAN